MTKHSSERMPQGARRQLQGTRGGERGHTAALFLLLMLLSPLPSTPSQAAGPAMALTAQKVFRPDVIANDIALDGEGRVYVCSPVPGDAWIEVFDRAGSLLERIVAPEPKGDMAGGASAIDVDSQGNILALTRELPGMLVLERSGKLARVIERDWLDRPWSSLCWMPKGKIAAAGQPGRQGGLVELCNKKGKKCREMVAQVPVPGPEMAEEAANVLHLASFGDGRLAVAFAALGEVAVYSKDGEEISRFQVPIPEISRSIFFKCRGEEMEARGRSLEPLAQRPGDVLADLEAACSDGAAHFVEYISDMTVCGEDVLLLIDSRIHRYGAEGALKGVYEILDPQGRPMRLHRIDASGSLCAGLSYFGKVALFRLDGPAGETEERPEPEVGEKFLCRATSLNGASCQCPAGLGQCTCSTLFGIARCVCAGTVMY